MRIPATEIFRDNGNDTITITRPVQIGGVTLSGGVTFSRGVTVGGLELAELSRRPLEGDVNDSGVYVITHYYE